MDDKLYMTLAYVQKKIPWASIILKDIKIKIDDNCNSAYVTANKENYLMVLGEAFFTELDEKSLAFVIEHELLHIVYAHIGAAWAENMEIANIAMDAIINESTVLNSSHSLLNNRVTFDALKKHFDLDCNLYSHTSKDIYDALIDKNGEGEGEGEGESSLKNFDETNINDLIEQNEATGEMKAIGPKIDTKKVAKNIGDVSGKLAREIKKYNDDIANNFKQLFKMFVGKSLRQNKKATWKKSSRRFGAAEKGKKKDNKPSVLIVVDTSGSMSDDALEKINFQISHILKHYELTVCWGDTCLENYKKVKKKTKFKAEYIGRGGTNLNFWENVPGKYDLVVFNTDGYIPEIGNKKQKKVFCIFENGCQVENEKNIMF